MSIGKRLLGMTAILIGTVGLLAVPSPASARQPAVPVGHVLRAGMVVVRFDRAVADANGYEIRVDKVGREYSVRKGSPPSDVAPAGDPVKDGACGVSFIWFDATGGRHASIDTGFGVNGSAIRYSWHVSIFDGIGSSTRDWGGGLFFRATWEGTSDFASGTTGYAWATVNSATSWAALTDGRVCYSVGPWDDTILY